jgi:high-affinity nickel permease
LSFEFLFEPLERADAWLEGVAHDAPLAAALVLAVVLGLRHASDPDHLVAVSSLTASGERGGRFAMRIGAWWGLGHAAVLLAVGLPLIAVGSQFPDGLARAAETAVGVVIIALALRVLWRRFTGQGLHAGDARGPREAFAVGFLHGLAGTGAVVVLLLAAMPSAPEAAAAMSLFALASVVSMASLSAGFGWVLARPGMAGTVETVLVPALGLFGLTFGLWYVGI